MPVERAEPTGNKILDALPAGERSAVLAHAKLVELEAQQPVYGHRRKVANVYFPVGCVVAMVQRTEDGSEAELTSVGREGMIGARVVLDPGASVLPSLCVIPGSAYAVPVAAFAKVVEASAKFRQLVYRYTSIFAFDLAQHSVCNRFHGPVQRLARWLLLDFDRSEGPTIQITHESLAQLLGVQRPAVSLAAAQLQKSGAIAYKRGRITLKSRMRLEAQACECYRAIAAEWRRLH